LSEVGKENERSLSEVGKENERSLSEVGKENEGDKKNERSLSEVDKESKRSLSEDLAKTELKKLEHILAHLQTHETIIPKDPQMLTGKYSATARRYLVLLCDKGILESTGNTNAKIYHRKMLNLN
jgi:predicted HTH transcriptional regulator